MKISVIIPTYNPSIERLNKTILGLAQQSSLLQELEVILIDNNSKKPFIDEIVTYNYLSISIVSEPKQGLTYARLKGFHESKGDIIIMVDDDNVLDADYLKNVVQIFDNNPKLGAIGGIIEAEFEVVPPNWTKEFWGKLAIRDLGIKSQVSDFNGKHIDHYPDFAPVGAGMAIKRKALNKYIIDIENQKESISDRNGDSLSSSGDNEIVMYVLKSGFEVGYFPELKLIHLIPSNRLTKDYLSRLNYGIMNSWTKFLIKHHLCPWKTIPKWTVSFRKVKAYLIGNAWKNEVNYIKWKGACGMFEGLTQ